jgi:hypothetical protein
LTNIEGVFATTFMDIGEDGTLDMIVMADTDYSKVKTNVDHLILISRNMKRKEK